MPPERLCGRILVTQMQRQVTTDPWWKALYDEFLAEALLVRGDATEVERTLEFLKDALRLRSGMRIFDQCCGIGSLSIPLAHAGFQVVGLDQAEGYIERARRDAEGAGGPVTFVAGDAFEYVCAPACDAALNWWTSYGYADTEAQNWEMLRRARESLVPGGRFALDVPNLAGVLHAFEADRTDVRETPLGSIEMRRVSRVDLPAGRLLKKWTFRVGGETRTRETSVQLALPHDHIRALEHVGFRVVASYGDIDGRPLDLECARCILVAEAVE